MNKVVIATKLYSCHPEDQHLSIVLCVVLKASGYEFATWVYNSRTNSYDLGRYYVTPSPAIRDFLSRGVLELNSPKEAAHTIRIFAENLDQWKK